MRKLWIFGDSFANLVVDSPDRIWQRQLVQQLCQHENTSIELHVVGLPGSSQDWALEQFVLSGQLIDKDDWVIFVATSPSRYWYFKDKPSLSNWHILDFDEACTREQSKAVELYIKHIQRLELDVLQCASRMGLIAYETHRLDRRPVIVIPVSSMTAGPADRYTVDIKWALGDLSTVQFNEYSNPAEAARRSRESVPGYFEGVDCRYNHLCLRNHDVLAEKIFQAFINDSKLDLTTGFHREFVDVDWCKDPEFVEQELNQQLVPFYHKMLDKYHKNNYVPWKKRTGVEDILG
jgi:hypothetical protein